MAYKQKRFWWLWLVLLALLGGGWLVLHSGANNDEPVSRVGLPPEKLKYFQPFREKSIFYQKIPANAEVDPNSKKMIEGLIKDAKQGFVLAVKEWTVPVYYADSKTPTYDVRLTADWAPKKILKKVPIPDFARPDPEADAHLVVVDEQKGCIYDFWEMKKTGNGWSAGWGNALPLDSDGIFPSGFSARGSGFELLQGLIWPQELVQGAINHALIFSYDYTKAGGPVEPATESDGDTDADWAIPEGALLQLDPNLNLATLGLNSYEMTIAKALQEYGMYLADDGGGVTLYAVNPISARTDPYQNIFDEQDYLDGSFILLDKIPAEKFRVLKLPAQKKQEPLVVANRCAQFE